MSEDQEIVVDEFESMSHKELGDILGNDQESIARRIRLLWYLRNKEPLEESVDALARGLGSSSVLLQHEICYVMGQIQSTRALPILYQTLDNPRLNVMTRHEAGEAIGAIGKEESLSILTPYLKHENEILRQTCELAVERINRQHGKSSQSTEELVEIKSVDPATPFSEKKSLSLQELREILLNPKESLYKRYKAMFSLRNRAHAGSEEAVHILCEGFKHDEGALFKHEIAFVLGQLQHKASAKTLERVLRDTSEHEMVRHEAAEALGSICDRESLSILDTFQNDDAEPVRHSCEVAIDMHKYWSQFENHSE